MLIAHRLLIISAVGLAVGALLMLVGSGLAARVGEGHTTAERNRGTV